MGVAEPRTFYDHYPLDWVQGYSPEELRAVISPLLVETIDALRGDELVLDVGCGAGRVLSYLAKRGLRCAGVDLSRESVRRATSRSGRPGVVGNNLRLPIRDGVADLVISDGVAHHTGDPRAAITENARVAKLGGRLYLGVYKPGGRYEFLYRWPGSWIRAGLKHNATRLLVYLLALVPYYAAHLVKSGGRRNWSGAKMLFYDYFASPRVEFLSREVVERWAAEMGLELAEYRTNPGSNVHSFVFRKAAGNGRG